MNKAVVKYLIDNSIKGTEQFKTLKASLIASFFTTIHYENRILFMGRTMITFVSTKDDL